MKYCKNINKLLNILAVRLSGLYYLILDLVTNSIIIEDRIAI